MNRGNDADEIIPRLWLGNVKASKDIDFIRHNNITVVFNCTKNLEFCSEIPIKYRIPLDDNLEEEEIRNMELWSSEIAYKIISEYMKGHTILIHCMAGMQRSAGSLAIALILLQRKHADEVIQFIKSKRSIAFFPKANFGRSVYYFDKKFHDEIIPELIKQGYIKQKDE